MNAPARTTPHADEPSVRRQIAGARRVVIKIGSSSITSLSGGLDRARLDALATAIETRMRGGSDVMVVSSGAISAGMLPLGLNRRPVDTPTKQAAASAGQLELARAWGESFGRYGRTVGQVLLTAGDIGRRESARNAQATLDRLRTLHAVPVINENDTVATAEIRFGDNDRLAALTAHLVAADALILLSDVDGLYTADPRLPGSRRLPFIARREDLDAVVAGEGGALGTGGMASKVAAAQLAADCGIPVLLGAAGQADELMTETTAGTVFAARRDRLPARKFWVRHAADAQGVLRIDAGALNAVVRRRRSLLAAGVTGVDGDFVAGDVVEILGPEGVFAGRGVTGFSSADLHSLLGRSSEDLPEGQRRPVVHADDLVT